MSNTGNYTWTVLIYTASDEDLKPFILRQLDIIKAQVIADNVQVVIQVSLKTNQQDSKICNQFANSFELSGRYLIENQNAVLLEELENPDMTNPKSLLDFLLWGTMRFHSERLMLIVSGHSLGFVGLLASSSDKQISLMSIPGFARALSRYKKDTGTKIDLLVLDTCFMDMVETTYEVALVGEQAVDYVVLPHGNPSLAGMPCDLIINRLSEDQASITLDQWLAETISLVNQASEASNSIFAIKLIQEYYLELKILTDGLAEYLLHDPNRFTEPLKADNTLLGNHFPELNHLMEILDFHYPELREYTQRILGLQQKIVNAPLEKQNVKIKNSSLRIFLPNSPSIYSKYSDFYNRLSFVDRHRWLQVLQKIHSQV